MSPTKTFVKMIDSNIKSPGDVEYDKQNCLQHLLFFYYGQIQAQWGKKEILSSHFSTKEFFFEVLDNFAYYNRESQGSFTRIFHFQKYLSWNFFLIDQSM